MAKKNFPSKDSAIFSFYSLSQNHTLRIGGVIAKHLQTGDLLCLFGQLGSGKTLLTKGIAAGLGIEKENVISPSFVLVHQYRGRLPLNHIDLYRLKNQQEILTLGYEEYLFDEAVTVIEWADRLEHLLPAQFLKIELSVKGDKKRLLKFSAFGQRHKTLLGNIKQAVK